MHEGHRGGPLDAAPGEHMLPWGIPSKVRTFPRERSCIIRVGTGYVYERQEGYYTQGLHCRAHPGTSTSTLVRLLRRAGGLLRGVRTMQSLASDCSTAHGLL